MTTTDERTSARDAATREGRAARPSAHQVDDAPTTVIDVVQAPVGPEVVLPKGSATTTVSAAPAGPVGPRRRIGGPIRGDVPNLFGAALAGLSTAILLFGAVAPFSGRLGFVVVAYLGFLGTYAVLTSLDADAALVRDRVMTVVLASGALVLFGVLAVVVGFVVYRGREALPHLNFFTQDQSTTGPLDPLTHGGVLHALIGTLEMMSICLVITVPLGISCAVFLAVLGGRGSRFVRTVVEAMTALPSIVAGLFILATWILILGNDKSGLSAALALSVMMLPIIIRSADVVLRLVPGHLREASEALGAPRWRTVWHVILPTSKSGLATAVILGTARGIGETSPVLLTAGYNQYKNFDPTSGPMTSLPLAAFTFVRSPQPNVIARGFATAALLMILVVVLFVVARFLGGRGAGQLSNRQRRRVARQSVADVERFDSRHLAAAGARSLSSMLEPPVTSSAAPAATPPHATPPAATPPRPSHDPTGTC